jgi:hypothetical protein
VAGALLLVGVSGFVYYTRKDDVSNFVSTEAVTVTLSPTGKDLLQKAGLTDDCIADTMRAVAIGKLNETTWDLLFLPLKDSCTLYRTRLTSNFGFVQTPETNED